MDWEDRATKALNVTMLAVVAVAFVATTIFMIYQQAELFSSLPPADRLRHWGSLLPPLLMTVGGTVFAFRFLRRRQP